MVTVQSLARVRIGGQEYPCVTAKGCRVCGLTERREVERQAVEGRPLARIVESLPPQPRVTVRNVRDHLRAHLPIHEESVRQFVERQAEEHGEVVEAGVERVVDFLGFAEAVVGRVGKRLAAGEVQPSIKDALRAVEVLARFTPEPQGVDERAVALAMLEYHTIAESLMDPDTYAEFGRRLRASEVLAELAQDWEDRQAALQPPSR